MSKPIIDPKERLRELRRLVSYHREKYHRDDAPEISDEAYDALLDELIALEASQEGVVTSDIKGGQVSEAFTKVIHEVEQWSFDKVTTEEELIAWEDRAKRYLKEADVSTAAFTYEIEHKIDGLKLVLTYEAGKLKRAVTRGDGVTGEDVTHTARTITSVPATLSFAVDLICVGEVWLPKAELERINSERAKRQEPLFANPRNAAAGSLRQLDPEVARSRNLQFYAYDIDRLIVHKTGVEIPTTQADDLKLLKKLGLPVNPYAKTVSSHAEIETYFEKWKTQRDTLPYNIDGLVIKLNDKGLHKVLGYTAKAPRFGVAYKFPADISTTIVEAIDLQVGRTGVVTPVAHLRPVRIAGSTVARATLHNEDQIKRLDVRIGDTVILQKAGDIIPEVVSVVMELRPKGTKRFQFPTHVPQCGGEGLIERIPGEAAYRCVVLESPFLQRQQLYHAVSKAGLNLDGVGPKLIDALLDAELISNLADLFTLTKDELLTLPGIKDRSAENIVEAIRAGQTQPLWRVLTALSIEQVGEETARLLSKQYGTLTALLAAKEDNIAAIHGIGDVVATSLRQWFTTPKNIALLEQLLPYLTIVDEVGGGSSEILKGETVVVTGTLPTLSRDEAKALIRQHGGTVASSVSKKTTLVVVGEEAGSKAKEAKRLGVKTTDEAGFLARIASNSK